MRQSGLRILLSVAFVLMLVCAVRAVRRPAASAGAQKTDVRAGRVQSDGAAGRADVTNAETANELQVRRLKAAGEAQRTKQQEAANELQRRQQEAARVLSDNPGVSVDAAGG